VTVLNGVVQVSENATASKSAPVSAEQTVRLAAGDEAEIGTSVGMGIVRNVVPNVQRTVAWRARRLVFPGTAVSDIANEFNRYNRVRIRVEGEALRQRKAMPTEIARQAERGGISTVIRPYLEALTANG